ncbi:EamA family transporter [Nakamurella deserti]|uniref:EamA family transporter n=1 Tax=Nakamurella deserti TaxID=2164074 RepID=UPI000DBE98D8|nr:EamA family transporter [Nakamurella deserti]
MTTTTGAASVSAPTAADTRGSRSGLAMLLGSALSAQVGAAVGSTAFPVIGPVGVVAVRQFVSAIALLVVARPRLWTFSWFQWRPTILLGLVFGVMNFGLYTAVDRIGLGLAVTLEFLGPLAVALATAWTVRTAAIAALAVAGVVLLTDPSPTTDWIGVGAGLLAAGCWAAYILLNREVGRRLPGVQGSAAAATLSALCFIPIGIVTFVHHPPTGTALVAAVVVGLLSSVVPQIADLLALRRLPAAVFGILMSAHPVFAALVGLIGLGQHLGAGQWAGIGVIITANVASVLVAARAVTAPAERRVVVPAR